MDELDTLLAEAEALLEDVPSKSKTAAGDDKASSSSSAVSACGHQRCLSVQLSPAGTGAVCSRLRCTDCDMSVLCFDGQRWSRAVDYLFLRNSHPQRSLLGRMLQPASDSCAFCCQCRWISCDSVKSPPRCWICGKH